VIGEGLSVCHEQNSKYNSCVMAVYRENGPDNENINVGHILSRFYPLCFFLKHGGKNSAKVKQETYRASKLEVPFTVYCASVITTGT